MGVAQLVGCFSCGFDSWSGHMPRLRVRFPVRVHIGGNQLMFLSLSFSLSKISKHILR